MLISSWYSIRRPSTINFSFQKFSWYMFIFCVYSWQFSSFQALESVFLAYPTIFLLRINEKVNRQKAINCLPWKPKNMAFLQVERTEHMKMIVIQSDLRLQFLVLRWKKIVNIQNSDQKIYTTRKWILINTMDKISSEPHLFPSLWIDFN